MHLTHNTIVALLWFVVFASGGLIGGLIAWWRLSYRLDECCGCCTCQECEPELIQPKLGRGYSFQFDEHGNELPAHEWTATSLVTGERRDGSHPGGPMQWGPGGRRTIVLEPGPTIYQSLADLSDEALDGPVRHAEPITSTWLRGVLLDLERRYPIPLDSPRGSMTETL